MYDSAWHFTIMCTGPALQKSTPYSVIRNSFYRHIVVRLRV